MHAAVLHLTAKIFDGVAFEESGPLHLLSVWSVLAANGGGARDELVVLVSQVLGRLSASSINALISPWTLD